jgi:hypothetical protein
MDIAHRSLSDRGGTAAAILHFALSALSAASRRHSL